MKTAAHTIQGKGKYIIDSRGRRTGVILDIKTFEEMMEDLEDLRMMAERKDEPTVSLAEVEKKLKAHGLI